MKALKQTAMLLAGLSIMACSNEDVTDQQKNMVMGKNAAISLNIKNTGMTKALGTPAENTDETGKSKITVANLVLKFIGTTTTTKEYTVNVTSGQPVVLYGVPEGTTGFEVVGNFENGDGDGNYFTSTSKVQTELEEPVSGTTVYGMTEELTLNGTVTNTDNSNGGTQNTTYTNYTAEVTVRPVTSRVELSGLVFEPFNGQGGDPAESDFTALKLLGVFMNGHFTGGSYANGQISTSGAVKRYTTNPTETGLQNYIDKITGEVDLYDGFKNTTGDVFYATDVTVMTPTLPTGGQVYGYNFFVTPNVAENAETTDGCLPNFTVALAPTYKPGKERGEVLYAVITKYVKDGTSDEIKNFQPGKLYQITDLALPERALTPDPSGNQEVAITATVTVTDWTLVATDANWAGE